MSCKEYGKPLTRRISKDWSFMRIVTNVRVICWSYNPCSFQDCDSAPPFLTCTFGIHWCLKINPYGTCQRSEVVECEYLSSSCKCCKSKINWEKNERSILSGSSSAKIVCFQEDGVNESIALLGHVAAVPL